MFRTRFRKVALSLVGIVVVTLVALVLNARRVIGADYSRVPLPPIAADTTPAGVARGEMLFQSLCIGCHGGADGRATGKHLDEIPAFLGTAWSANLAHPETGVRARTDGQIARVLRTGVLPDGRLSVVMNGFGAIGDADIAAILGYMRSGAPAFAPGGEQQPRSRISTAGALILTYVAKVSADRPAHVAVPEKAPNAEYGRYMAQVMDCATCHTDGFGSDKIHDPAAFAGGFELVDPTGTPIYTRNITMDADTGIGRWSKQDFARAVTRGVRPDGVPVRKPMPLFARLDDIDVSAIYTYLRTIPPVRRANKAGGHSVERARPDATPEQLFVTVGCVACHGANAPYKDKLRGATTKSDSELASWILDPQATRPGSPMPSFQGALDRSQAEALGRYARTLATRDGS